MQKMGKLELTWVGKYDEKVVEPRILVEDKSKSYGDPSSENMLIHGDNLIALQALQQEAWQKILCRRFSTKVKNGAVKRGGFWLISPSSHHSRQCAVVCAPQA